MLGRRRWAASSWVMKVSVEPESTIMRAEVVQPPQGEEMGTSCNSKRLPELGAERAWLEA